MSQPATGLWQDPPPPREGQTVLAAIGGVFCIMKWHAGEDELGYTCDKWALIYPPEPTKPKFHKRR